MVRSPICVWGVGWSDAVTKWHLMRGDDDHEFEIVITRSHSLLCFLTASIQKMDYQSIFQCKLSGFNNRNTDYMYDCMMFCVRPTLQYGSTVNVITGGDWRTTDWCGVRSAEQTDHMYSVLVYFWLTLTLTIQCQWSLKCGTTGQPSYYW